MTLSLPSVVEPFRFDGRNFYVKRDDLIHPLVSGNKYRKLFTLFETPAQKYHTLRSYGGTQSNAMLSIAALCHNKGWRFEYLCKERSSILKAKPSGNLKMAQDLGMHIIEIDAKKYDQTVTQWQAEAVDPGLLLLRQGGADPMARAGIGQLAEEIMQWQKEQGFSSITVVTPSGTGTTAFYLAKSLPMNRVYTSAVVGDDIYLKEQMQRLGALPENLHIFKTKQKFPFAKPKRELLTIYESLKDAGIEFDLIYGAKTWLDLIGQMDEMKEPILYVHSGGIMGNETMLERYVYKGIVG